MVKRKLIFFWYSSYFGLERIFVHEIDFWLLHCIQRAEAVLAIYKYVPLVRLIFELLTVNCRGWPKTFFLVSQTLTKTLTTQSIWIYLIRLSHFYISADDERRTAGKPLKNCIQRTNFVLLDFWREIRSRMVIHHCWRFTHLL